MRIAVVTETYPPELNGVALTLGRAVEFLRDRGHDVSLVRPRQRKQANEGNAGEILVTGVPIPSYPGTQFGLPAGYRLRRQWRDSPPAIVHVATEGPLGWSALWAARGCGIPVTSDYRTHFHRYSAHYGVGALGSAIDGYLRAFHNRTQATFVATEALRAELSGHGYRNCITIGRGVDNGLFHPGRRSAAVRAQWGAAPDDTVFIHVGRLAAEKNLELAARAFEQVRAVHPSARMVWVGDGPLRARLERAHPHHVFCGFATGAALATLYASADVFLFPSLTETFGNVALEALASGLALIAFRYGAAGGHCSPGVNACLPSVGDEDAFVHAALELAAAPATLARIRAAAPCVVASLAWPAVLARFEDCLIACARTGAHPMRAYAAG
jgi:glycosyltransferase involved in cell wall biosynthesis